MSDTWNEGYFTDVGYTYGYYREINPVFQRFCLLLRGFAAPAPAADAQHCELGFGQGVSVNIHAAANPGGYVATDFNPAHAAHANTLAAAAGSGARLVDDSFEQLLARTDLPQFDSISLHGIWTWVSRDNHQVIAEFARRHLKPGGVFYNSYNCFPGWSPAYPLRQLFALHDRFAATPHGASERVDAALKFSEALLAAQPNYLQVAPQLPDRLKSIMGQNRHYLAHEYFNRDWNCMYFTDVVDRLAPAKLDYACTAVPLDGVDVVNLRADAQAFLQGIDHPILREQARDYFVNQQFRKDLYVRGAVRLPAIEQRERLLDIRVVLLQSPESVALKVNGAIGEATLQEAVYQPLLAALAANGHAPKTVRQLAASLPGMAWGALEQAVAILAGMGAVAPCHDEAATQQVKARCQALNRHLCERAQYGNDIETLASPVTGGGVAVNRFQQLFLRAREQGKKQPAEWAQGVWQVLAAHGQSLVKEGKTLTTPEDNLAELTAQAQEFAEKRLPILKALQIA
jgi:SAM-dependent methyltransferase